MIFLQQIGESKINQLHGIQAIFGWVLSNHYVVELNVSMDYAFKV
jgi:hypothetical protein